MRSCVYCGKTLEKGEKCNCAQSVRARGEKSSSNQSYWQGSDNVYTTGYTHEEKKKRKKRFTFKKPDFSRLNLIRFLKDPVGSVFNIKQLNVPGIIIANAIVGIIIAFCSLKIFKTPFLNAIMFVRCAVGIFLFLCALAAVFICIERFILRQKSQANLFATRLMGAAIPLMIFSMIGAVLSLFPGFSAILVWMIGILIYLIMLYEVLKVQWRALSASGVLYLMCAGFGVIFVILFNIIRI